MSLRPPSAFRSEPDDDPLAAALDFEIMAEKAGTHGRLLRRLDAALERLRAFDAGDETVATSGPDRADLVARAGEALWHLVIQRELMRLPGTARLMRDLDVPAEVRLAMGVRRLE